MDKCITNHTNEDVTVTIYLAEFTKNGVRTKETHTLDIAPQQFKEISLGNAVNSFISGIEVSASVNGVTFTSSQKIDATDSEFSVAINQNYFIEIKNVQALEIALVE